MSDEIEFLSSRKGRQRTEALHISNNRTNVGGYDERGAVIVRGVESNDVSLRQWLDNTQRRVDSLECLHIFSQVVDVISVAHSQGFIVHNLRPSCFVMTSLNKVSFIESASCSDSSSEFPENGLSSQMAEFNGSSSSLPCDSHSNQSQLGVVDSKYLSNQANLDSQMNSEISFLQSCTDWAIRKLEAPGNESTRDTNESFSMKQILRLEASWYTSPEEASGCVSSCASDVYRLGVLLFELFCTFGSTEEKSTTMASLRHRVLPPQLLLNWPKEATFSLWLLHPEPNNRPKMSEVLQSKFLNEPKDDIGEREAAIKLRDEIEEQESLLEFLLLLQQRKQGVAESLNEKISVISSDIDEVTKLQMTLKAKGALNTSLDELKSDERGDESQKLEGTILSKNSRLMTNFRKLESMYLLSRRRTAKPVHRGSIPATERSTISNPSSSVNEQRPSEWIDTFLEGLRNYLSFSKLKFKAELKQGDLLNSSNLVCSLSFDRDGEFFATAGVNKKIKVFDYNSILNDVRDIHYPVVEMASSSMLSSICWNGYTKSQIASSNFEGTVQVWDVTRSQVFTEMREHARRVWSVDFSLADPTMLASGSDDGSVKLWNINQGVSVGTIKTKANICCVQFSAESGRTLAFGSADHRIYYYDLRNSKMPLCTLVGHDKTVSYVKFVSSTNLVSASTDNTLKLWDLSMCTSRILDYPLQSYTGHLNVKNFVGLSVSEGYIATGSETNEVCVYHKAFPMPVVSFKFSSTDPLEADDNSQFISSVCWRGQSTALVAANSMGNIKLLEMV